MAMPRDDELFGGAGGDKLNGGAGRRPAVRRQRPSRPDGEVVPRGGGQRHPRRRRGYRFASYTASLKAINGSLRTGKAIGEGTDTLIDIENLAGTRFNDTLEGNHGDNELAGLAGNDEIFGLGGNDTILGSAGADKIDGGDGLRHGDLQLGGPRPGEGLAGNVLQIILGTGEAQGDIYISIEKFIGSPDQDRVTGSGNVGITIARRRRQRLPRGHRRRRQARRRLGVDTVSARAATTTSTAAPATTP